MQRKTVVRKRRRATPATFGDILFVLIGMGWVLYDSWTNNPELAPHATATIVLAIVIQRFIKTDFKHFPARVLFSLLASLGILSFFF
tara:strand:+ start:235 stop:495 length:261 start_codon:yes stop_codon:yes gene_type:complete